MAELVEKEVMGVSEALHSSDTESNREASTKQEPKQNPDQSDDPATLAGPKLYAILTALLLTTLMFSLDTMIMATAIPKITDDFHTIVDIGWYVTAYMLCNAALQPLTGKVYTYFNLTYSYLAFIALFEVGSIVCATAPTSSALVVGRAIAGMGASGLTNGSLTILGAAAAPEQRPALLGLIMSMMGLGQIIAPLIGGALAQHATWRWCFWINLPVGAVCAVVLFLIRVPNPNQKRGLTLRTFVRKFDIVGFFIFAPACIMILLAFQWAGNQHAWKSATIIGLLCGSILMFCLFVAWERYHGDDAMFPGSLLKQRVIYSSCITAALHSGAIFISGYYIALWFQAIKRASPTMSAVYTLPTFGFQIVGVIVSSVAISKIGFFTPFALIGAGLMAISSGLMSTFSPETNVGSWIGFQIILGIGRGFAFQQPTNAMQANLRGSQMSTGMAVVAWAQFFGAAVFIALAETSFSSFLRDAIHEFTPTINPTAVVNAGATNYLSLHALTTPALAQALLTAYNQAVVRVFYLAAGCSAVAVFTCFGMGWKRVFRPKAKVPTQAKEDVKTDVETAT